MSSWARSKFPGLLLLTLLCACLPRGRAVAPDAEPMTQLGYKRVETWRYGELGGRPTAVERQLKRYFEGVFSYAQFSASLTCVARERARFLEVYGAAPDDALDLQVLGRCGAPIGVDSRMVTIHSDGTLLDRPLSAELLSGIERKIARSLPPFLSFGITARYAGPDVLVSLALGTPTASIFLDAPDRQGRVRVRGRVRGDYLAIRAIINQGEVGTADCERDAEVELPEYSVSCPLSGEDDEAWIEVSAERRLLDDKSAAKLLDTLGVLQARRAGSRPPAVYRRKSFSLPRSSDVRRALIEAINALRRKAGAPLLGVADEAAPHLQRACDELFSSTKAGNPGSDIALSAELTSGRGVRAPIWWAHGVVGVAVDGSAADWLSARLESPNDRRALLNPRADQIAIAVHYEHGVGFGATAVLYSFFTPEREHELADQLATRIAELRGDWPTQRLDDDGHFERAARLVSSGQESPRAAFTAALKRTSASGGEGREVVGLFLDLPYDPLEVELPKELGSEDELSFGIVVAHEREPGAAWSHPVAFVWFFTDSAPAVEAVQPSRRDGSRADRPQPAAGVRAL